MPVAFFVVCIKVGHNSEESRLEAAGYVDAVRGQAAGIAPLDVGLFAGRLDYGRLPSVFSTVVRNMGEPETDYRDWDAIRAWAGSLRPALLDA